MAPEYVSSAAHYVIGVCYGTASVRVSQKRLQILLAGKLGQPGEVLAVKLQQVEGVKHYGRFAIEAVFEEREVGAPASSMAQSSPSMSAEPLVSFAKAGTTNPN